MQVLALPLAATTLPAARFRHWLGTAWIVFRRAPLRIGLLAFVPVLFEGLCQLLPDVGIVLSKLLTPLAGALALVLLDRRVRHGVFEVRGALRLWGARLPALPGVVALCAGVFLVQLGVVAVLAGPDQAVAIATGAMHELRMSRVQIGLMLAAGLVPGLALLTVMPRVVLDARGVAAAMADNAQALRRAWKPVALSMLVTGGMLAALPWWPWLLLVLLPFGLTVGYAMYRDLFPASTD